MVEIFVAKNEQYQSQELFILDIVLLRQVRLSLKQLVFFRWKMRDIICEQPLLIFKMKFMKIKLVRLINALFPTFNTIQHQTDMRTFHIYHTGTSDN